MSRPNSNTFRFPPQPLAFRPEHARSREPGELPRWWDQLVKDAETVPVARHEGHGHGSNQKVKCGLKDRMAKVAASLTAEEKFKLRDRFGRWKTRRA